LDFVNKSRKFILQSRATLETTRGVRLSYIRWLVIIALLGFHFLDLNFRPTPLPFSLDTPLLLIGIYAVFNLISWLISLTVGKGNNAIVNVFLIIDLIVTTGICSQFDNTQLFFFPYIFALLITIMIGVGEGIGAAIFILVANVATDIIRFQKFDLRTTTTTLPISLELVSLGLTILIYALAIYIITSSPKPLTQLQDELLEEAVARANTANLTELQNRVKAIYRVANTLNNTLDYQKVIGSILRELESVFDVSVGAVLLFDKQSNLRVEDGLRLNQAERQMTVPIKTGIMRDSMMSGSSSLVNDARTLQELYAIFPSLQGCPGVILMPMRGGFEVFGMVIIASRQENAYTSQDLEWVTALTSHPVVALQNAQLYNSILQDRNKMIRDVEEVRHTLARNLHDGPAQAVAAFSMQAEFIRRLIKSDPDKAVEELSSLGRQAQQTSKEIRNLLFELRPLALESQGLIEALEQYASRFPINPDDPKVQFSANNYQGRISPNVETTIFTVLQEAVNNARKHAQAQHIWLSLDSQEGYIIASAQDDGKGFDVKAVESNYDKRGSLGMTNMHERAALVNGTFQLNSVPGRGTIAILKIPLNQANTSVPATNLNSRGH